MDYHPSMAARNVYFDLTRRFNEAGTCVILGSGQAVVYHRLAIMSKDGDWIIKETPEACRRVLEVLEGERRVRYRAGAPLDVRWLAGGWSSHLEFVDEQDRRIRCDFFSRPPKIAPGRLHQLFDSATDPLAVIDPESLIAMKQTQRAKDYAIIGELARRLPPETELLWTTDPDRILELAGTVSILRSRPAVEAFRRGEGRRGVVRALAEEIDDLQLADRARLAAFAGAARPYLDQVKTLHRSDLELPGGHDRLLELADKWLPETLDADDE